MENNRKKLGKRICIVGLPCAGKSTLSVKLASKLDYPVLHLDQIVFTPGTNWVLRPHEETQKIHDEFIKQAEWIIDGQCKSLLPQRLSRTDTLILLKASRFVCLWRFLKRCQTKGNRPGGLENVNKEFSWKTVWQILYNQPHNRKKLMQIIADFPHLRIIVLHSFKEIDSFIENIS